jgi:hypothetical protein
MKFQVELVWNREFNFVPFGQPHETLERAIQAAKFAENLGDGAAVKKTQIVDEDGNVVWAYGKLVKKNE